MTIGIIGDIHGHADALARLLADVTNTVHELVFLGDYVNRGRQSADVIDVLIGLGREVPCTYLRGNHDAAFLGALDGDFDRFLTLGGAATVRSYIHPPYVDVASEFVRSVPDDHREFLEALADSFETEALVVAHEVPDARAEDRFRIGGHAPQSAAVPTIGEGYAYVDTGCGTLPNGTLTCLFWPSLQWRSVPAQ